MSSEIFLCEQYGVCDIQSNFQHIFRVLEALPQTPPGALYLYGPRWRRNSLFCPPPKQIPGYALVDCLELRNTHDSLFRIFISSIAQSTEFKTLQSTVAKILRLFSISQRQRKRRLRHGVRCSCQVTFARSLV